MSGIHKSQLNEFYQRASAYVREDLKPTYHTVAAVTGAGGPDQPVRFTCSLLLPALPPAENSHPGTPEATFAGAGRKKRDAEAAAAAAATTWLSQQVAFGALMPGPMSDSLAATIDHLLTNQQVISTAQGSHTQWSRTSRCGWLS